LGTGLNLIKLLVVLILVMVVTASVQGLRENRGQDVLNGLEIMTCNIGNLKGYQSLAREKVVDYLKLCGVPDVLFLQEVGDKNEAEYFSKKLGLNYFVFLNDFQGTYGIAILSKTPLSNHDQLYFKASRRGGGAHVADVMVGDQKVQVVNVHMDGIDPITIVGGKVEVNWRTVLWFIRNEILGDSVRSQSARELMQWLGEKKADHVILAGDFNSVPFSKAIRIIGSRFDDALWPSLQYLTGTYKRLNFPVSPRIDFLFLSSNLHCRSSSVLPISPGDHFPVKARVAF
jgi:endonuclease/exonuclease/phosphatase family metal-dependent hydrolase